MAAGLVLAACPPSTATPDEAATAPAREDIAVRVFAVEQGSGELPPTPGSARYDPELKVPVCDTVADRCDSLGLLMGRGDVGPEPNASNTLDGCEDGSGGTFHVTESLDRIRVVRADGTNLVEGKRVRIEVDVWVYYTYWDSLDLFYTADATRPAWTYLTTLKASATGAQTLMAEYVLPPGPLQAVRGNFRYTGSVAPCNPSPFDDHDDLVFAVGQEPDTRPPTVSLTSPGNGETVSGSVSVAVAAEDDFGVVAVEFYEGTTLLGTDTTAPYGVSWSTRSGPNGQRTLVARARDAAGNVGASQPVNVDVDNDSTAPVVSLTAPAPGAFVRGPVFLSASAADNKGVTRLAFYVDGSRVATTTPPTNYTEWNSLAAVDGSHTLTVQAYDASGNVGTSAAVTVTVDNTPPAVALTSPGSGQTVSEQVFLQASAGDHRGVTRVEFLVDGAVVAQDSEAPYEVGWDSRQVPNGAHTLTVRAWDVAGNPGTSAAVSFTVLQPGSAEYDAALRVPACAAVDWRCDTTTLVRGRGRVGPEPSASNTLDGCPDGNSGGWQASESLERLRVVRADGTDFAEGKRVRVEVDVWASSTSQDALDLFSTADATRPAWTYLTTLRPARTGAQTLTAEYVLPAGRLQAVRGNFRSTGSISSCSYGYSDDRDDLVFAVGQEPDNQPPVVRITSPEGGVTVSGTVPVAVAAEDDFGVTAVELYVGTTRVGTDNSAPFSVSWNAREVAEGEQTLTARAYDAAGHQTSSAGVTVWVDSTPPTGDFTEPAQGAVVRGTVQVSATASDNQSVTRVEFYDGSRLLGTDSTAPYGVSWETTTTGPDGSRWLTLRAHDAGGHVTSVSRPVTVDNTAPAVALTSPRNGDKVSGLSIPLTASASDNLGVTQVVFYDGTRVIGTDSTEPYSVEWNLLLLPKGQHTLTATAQDPAGHVTTSAPVLVTVQ
jgi:hypothetical protein